VDLSSESECESNLVRQLRTLAGAPEGNAKFVVVTNTVKVFVAYSSGSGSHVRFSVAYGQAPQKIVPPSAEGGYRAKPTAASTLRAGRPMNILLRSETPDDVDGKRQGIAVEFQTGDAAFDDEVYINTDTPHEVLNQVLASRALREAVIRLFREGISYVTLDDDGSMISCSLYTFAHRKHDGTRAERILSAMATLALETPPVEESGELAPPPQAPWLDWIAVAGGFILFFGVPIYLALVPGRCWDPSSDGDGSSLVCRPGCCEPMWQGLLLGLLLAIPFATLLSARIRGRSDSHARRSLAGGAIAWFVVTMTMCLYGIVRWRL
jgi:hypothetical protein